MFCLDYYPSSKKYIQDVGQLKIKYHPADRTLEQFLKTYTTKTIIINVTNNFQEIDAQLLEGLYNKYQNIKILFDFNNKDHLTRAGRYHIPYFFINHVTTIDQLNGLIQYYPTDMYICQELGFSLDKVSKLLHSNNIRVRVFPNICQSSFYDTPSIKTFFIRPDDIKFYTVFVDVFELISDEPRQEVLYKIYKEEKWFGKIKDVIPTFRDELDNRYLTNLFGMFRSKCNKRCMYEPSCSICERYIELAETFQKNKIVRRTKKKN